MKLRISGNSIRMRLNEAEVQRLVVDRQAIVGETRLPNGNFGYVLEAKEQRDVLEAMLGSSNEIRIQINAESIAGWDTDDRVGFEHRVPLPGGNSASLYLLVEKDFPCAHAPIESKTKRKNNIL